MIEIFKSNNSYLKQSRRLTKVFLSFIVCGIVTEKPQTRCQEKHKSFSELTVCPSFFSGVIELPQQKIRPDKNILRKQEDTYENLFELKFTIYKITLIHLLIPPIKLTCSRYNPLLTFDNLALVERGLLCSVDEVPLLATFRLVISDPYLLLRA